MKLKLFLFSIVLLGAGTIGLKVIQSPNTATPVIVSTVFCIGGGIVFGLVAIAVTVFNSIDSKPIVKEPKKTYVR